MMRALLMLPLLSACGGVASVDLFFSSTTPSSTGPTNVAITVNEGSGTAGMLLETRIARFMPGFAQDLRVPFGTQREVRARIETDDAQPRVLFAGRSSLFKLEDGDSPSVLINMAPAPALGVAMAVANSGRVASATVAFAIGGSDATGVDISEDPNFLSARTESHQLSSLMPTRLDIFPPQFEVGAAYIVDARCDDPAGCARTTYFRLTAPEELVSDVFSTTVIYDPILPRLIDLEIRLEGSSTALGGRGRADIVAVFDEPVLLDIFAANSGGSAVCPNQVEAVDGTLNGSDFPVDCAGTYTIEMTAMDLAGNTARVQDAALLLVDRVPPPAIDAASVTSTCAGQLPLLLGAPGAAEGLAIVDAAGVRVRADAEGAFVIATAAGQIPLRQIDGAGNESAPRNLVVSQCN